MVLKEVTLVLKGGKEGTPNLRSGKREGPAFMRGLPFRLPAGVSGQALSLNLGLELGCILTMKLK